MQSAVKSVVKPASPESSREMRKAEPSCPCRNEFIPLRSLLFICGPDERTAAIFSPNYSSDVSSSGRYTLRARERLRNKLCFGLYPIISPEDQPLIAEGGGGGGIFF